MKNEWADHLLNADPVQGSLRVKIFVDQRQAWPVVNEPLQFSHWVFIASRSAMIVDVANEATTAWHSRERFCTPADPILNRGDYPSSDFCWGRKSYLFLRGFYGSHNCQDAS